MRGAGWGRGDGAVTLRRRIVDHVVPCRRCRAGRIAFRVAMIVRRAVRVAFSRAPHAWAAYNQGIKPILADNGYPYQPPTVRTPSFPEFVSAHSTFTWPTLSAVAAAAGLSRRQWVIHVEQGDLVGRASGANVGAAVLAKRQSLFGRRSAWWSNRCRG